MDEEAPRMTTVEAVPPIRTTRPRPTPGSIVVAEVDEATRASICECLEAQGHAVVATTTLAEALAIGRSHGIDLVVVDVDIPDGRDWRALEHFGEHSGPVMLLTSFDDDDSVLRALDIGIHDQLSKPVRPAALVARVEAVLESRRLREALQAERLRLQQTSGIDPLTGMHTRTKMEEFLAFTAAAAARYGHALSVVLIDMDHLGKLANVHGDDAAKRVLAEVADHLAADLRKSDVAGRWNDDEFLVLLPHTDLKGAALFAERLRMTFAEMPVVLPNGTPATTSASFGCAQGTDVTALTASVEERVIDAKRSGRNVVKA